MPYDRRRGWSCCGWIQAVVPVKQWSTEVWGRRVVTECADAEHSKEITQVTLTGSDALYPLKWRHPFQVRDKFELARVCVATDSH